MMSWLKWIHCNGSSAAAIYAQDQDKIWQCVGIMQFGDITFPPTAWRRKNQAHSSIACCHELLLTFPVKLLMMRCKNCSMYEITFFLSRTHVNATKSCRERKDIETTLYNFLESWTIVKSQVFLVNFASEMDTWWTCVHVKSSTEDSRQTFLSAKYRLTYRHFVVVCKWRHLFLWTIKWVYLERGRGVVLLAAWKVIDNFVLKLQGT